MLSELEKHKLLYNWVNIPKNLIVVKNEAKSILEMWRGIRSIKQLIVSIWIHFKFHRQQTFCYWRVATRKISPPEDVLQTNSVANRTKPGSVRFQIKSRWSSKIFPIYIYWHFFSPHTFVLFFSLTTPTRLHYIPLRGWSGIDAAVVSGRRRNQSASCSWEQPKERPGPWLVPLETFARKGEWSGKDHF